MSPHISRKEETAGSWLTVHSPCRSLLRGLHSCPNGPSGPDCSLLLSHAGGGSIHSCPRDSFSGDVGDPGISPAWETRRGLSGRHSDPKSSPLTHIISQENWCLDRGQKHLSLLASPKYFLSTMHPLRANHICPLRRSTQLTSCLKGKMESREKHQGLKEQRVSIR